MKNEAVYKVQCIEAIDNEDKSRSFKLVTNHGLKFTIHLSKELWVLAKYCIREEIENERRSNFKTTY